MVVTKVFVGMYLLNLVWPLASTTRSRGKAGSLVVKMFITEESIVRNCPAPFVPLNNSAKSRGLALSIESQQGVRKAHGRLPGIWLSRLMLPKKVSAAA